MPRFAPRACLVLAAVACAACSGYPRDPERTSTRVSGGVMRVGVSHDPPFVAVDAEALHGRDVELARSFARSRGARVTWIRGGHDDLMRQLETFQLDLVIGGLDADSPWSARVATSRPYRILDADGHPVERVVALPPGENAWILAFDRHAHGTAAHDVLGRPARGGARQ